LNPTSVPVRRTTTQWAIVGVSANALSTFSLSGMILPRRQPPSAVMHTLAPQSLMRSRSASAENPPKTTVCGAPDARAGQHGDAAFWDHGHVDRDAVAGRDAEPLERVRELCTPRREADDR